MYTGGLNVEKDSEKVWKKVKSGSLSPDSVRHIYHRLHEFTRCYNDSLRWNTARMLTRVSMKASMPWATVQAAFYLRQCSPIDKDCIVMKIRRNHLTVDYM